MNYKDKIEEITNTTTIVADNGTSYVVKEQCLTPDKIDKLLRLMEEFATEAIGEGIQMFIQVNDTEFANGSYANVSEQHQRKQHLLKGETND